MQEDCSGFLHCYSPFSGVIFLIPGLLLSVAVLVGSSGPHSAWPKDTKPKVRVWKEATAAGSRVDVLFVPDGYQRKHLARKFWKDVGRYGKRLLKVKPFSDYKDRFQIAGIYLESKDAGCDPDRFGDEVDTALDCHFDSPGGRLLLFRDRKALQAAVGQVPGVDIAFVMVNTERFGGGGAVLPSITHKGWPLPAPVFSAQDTRSFQTALHELGHSMARLADEYIDTNAMNSYPFPEDDADLPYANVTRTNHIDIQSFEKVRETAKWRRFLDLRGAKKHRWAHEGGYFRARGVYRPWPRCKMRVVDDDFCPVCCMEMARAIHRMCDEPFDEDVWLKANPLRQWR